MERWMGRWVPRSAIVGAAVLVGGACGDRVDLNAPPMESDSTARAARSADYDAPVDPERWIGVRFPPYPDGVESLAASMLVRPFEAIPDDAWGFESVRVGGRPMLWLSHTVERRREPIMDGDRRIGWSITPTFRLEDALILPRMEIGERLELYACRTPDGLNVAAIGPYSDVQKTLGEVRWARGWDPQTGRIAEVDPSGVRCRNEAARPR